ncbi:hypothetical protein PoB_004294900 [Plakobranchus ocellatus]|uniref:Alcohol dehydrogenase-like N-terminal domain-containing protein n=1 Tax=Plakobranchus ocellatus TaxID=259542 RepID=A0AAV4B8L5_9GAST|nr:hypothetical protein PoB_004294900 [Plakobranchus ocellatus]
MLLLEGKRSRGKQREKLIEGLADWLKAGKSLEAIEATKDRKKWRTMIANACTEFASQGTTVKKHCIYVEQIKMRELRGNFSAQESAIIIKESEFNQELQPDEILIKTKACAINLQNEKIYHQLLSNSLENCPIGHSVSGIIVKTGSNVEKYEEDMCVVDARTS